MANQDDTLTASRRLTGERYEHKNRLKTAKGRRRDFLELPVGQRALEPSLKLLADFLAGKLKQKPEKPPPWLGSLIAHYRFTPDELAVMALAPLLNAIDRGWLDKDDNDSPQRALRQKMGAEFSFRVALKKQLRSENKAERRAAKTTLKTGKDWWKLKSDWTPAQYVHAGDWLMMQCVKTLNCFEVKSGVPVIVPECRMELDAIRDELMRRDQVLCPHLTPPGDWTGWRIQYDDRLQETFIRGRPECEAAITRAFLQPDFEHARGISNLRRVPLKIDGCMRDLVEQFTVDVMKYKGKEGGAEQRAANERTVAADVRDAKWIADRPFWLSYNCDFRGRANATQHLNFAREDHVRSLFKFAKGMRLDGRGIYWLEIHCANCEGSTAKEPRSERIKWVAENRRQKIQAIANDPFNTFDLWKDTDSPFCFVAACRELAAAWNDPENFETHLPIGFDGSANGLQHLALLTSDRVAGRMVNLCDFSETGEPQDAYGVVVAKVIELLKADDHKWAAWWRGRLALLNDRQRRKLLKTPAMTFAYGATPKGMADNIAKVYRKQFQGLEPKTESGVYLGRKIIEACAEILPEPASVMNYIRALAQHCMDQGRFLEWTTPTSFPVCNSYNKPNTITVNCGGGRRYRVANGTLNKIRKRKTLDSAAANFVHSMDATHLARIVNAAVSEGISDILTVHDCFYCLAPQATRFIEIILKELCDLYQNNDPLAELRNQNVSDPSNPDLFPVPPKGTLVLLDGKTISWEDGEAWRSQLYAYEVQWAENAFG